MSLMLLLALSGLRETPARPARGQANSIPGAAAPKAGGLRDPFKLPVRAMPDRKAAQTQKVNAPPPGRRGLAIGDLKLNGVVREDSSRTMIALVTAGNNRVTYFLRENDTLYDGAVISITPDSIEFKQNYLNSDGEVRSRQVIKRLIPQGGTGGEGQ
jgi:Tfp pilus assembly protein PilP